jgi:outer membrane protein assembly factor BamB
LTASNYKKERELKVVSVCALLILIVACECGFAGDWPQILGPHRDGKAETETLAASWPAAGPKLLWQRDVGRGYAGVAVVGNACILFHREGDNAIVERLDADTGKSRWKKGFPTHYESGIAPDDGPRCTPIVHDEHVYVFGADGDLHALNLADGTVVWSKDLYREFGAPSGYFGAGSTPLLEDELLFVNVGGKSGYGLVAIDAATGEARWHKTDEQASYSSPIATAIDGARQVIFVTRLNVVSVDPKTGEERFRFPFGMRGPTVNAAMPIVLGKLLFVTANYGVGAKLAEISAGGANVRWEKDEVLSSQYTTPIEHGGFLYGIHGRQDVGVAELRCVEMATGKVCWTEPNFGSANLIGIGDQLLIQKISGELVLAKRDPAKFMKLADVKLFPNGSVVQALPALSNGVYFVRDEGTLKALRVGP